GGEALLDRRPAADALERERRSLGEAHLLGIAQPREPEGIERELLAHVEHRRRGRVVDGGEAGTLAAQVRRLRLPSGGELERQLALARYYLALVEVGHGVVAGVPLLALELDLL